MRNDQEGKWGRKRSKKWRNGECFVFIGKPNAVIKQNKQNHENIYE